MPQWVPVLVIIQPLSGFPLQDVPYMMPCCDMLQVVSEDNYV